VCGTHSRLAYVTIDARYTRPHGRRHVPDQWLLDQWLLDQWLLDQWLLDQWLLAYSERRGSLQSRGEGVESRRTRTTPLGRNGCGKRFLKYFCHHCKNHLFLSFL
jgi:hypothetical protein